MKNPCETCLHAITCEAYDKHCKRKEAYDNWKKKAKEIRKHTQEVMRRARESE